MSDYKEEGGRKGVDVTKIRLFRSFDFDSPLNLRVHEEKPMGCVYPRRRRIDDEEAENEEN